MRVEEGFCAVWGPEVKNRASSLCPGLLGMGRKASPLGAGGSGGTRAKKARLAAHMLHREAQEIDESIGYGLSSCGGVHKTVS